MGVHVSFSENDNIVAKTRKKLGLSQADMAKLLHLSVSTISPLEKGKNRITGPLELLCKLLLENPDILKNVS